jgi:hypothetical protein
MEQQKKNGKLFELQSTFLVHASNFLYIKDFVFESDWT